MRMDICHRNATTPNLTANPGPRTMSLQPNRDEFIRVARFSEAKFDIDPVCGWCLALKK